MFVPVVLSTSIMYILNPFCVIVKNVSSQTHPLTDGRSKPILLIGTQKTQVLWGRSDRVLERGIFMEQGQNKLALLTRVRRAWNHLLTRSRLGDRKGQSTTEYILILAIVVMIATKLKTTLTTKVVGAVDNLNFDAVMKE